jgi:transcriptional regulator with XRE-family HTH domain|nr:MAG TPA: repressor protein [Caudoviricetes sp.]
MIYDDIEKLAKEKGISISKLENECGLGNKTIRSWKTSSPTIINLQKVANYFDVPIEYFLGK